MVVALHGVTEASMAAIAREHQAIPGHAELDTSLIVWWLVSGSFLITSVAVIGGWRWVLQVWGTSAALLGLLVVSDVVVGRRHQRRRSSVSPAEPLR